MSDCAFDPEQPATVVGKIERYTLYRQFCTLFLIEHQEYPTDWENWKATVIPNDWERSWLSGPDKVKAVLQALGKSNGR